MTALTHTAIDALPEGGRLKDDRVPGLEVRRHKSGVSFLLYYRTKKGVARRPKIGEYGAITIAQARDIARNMLAQVAGGGDPGHDWAEARGAPDVNRLWEYCEHKVYNRGKDWDKEAKRLYTVHIKPKLGKALVRDLTYAEVKDLHSGMHKTPMEANHAIAVLSRILAEAERLDWRNQESNPCRLVERYSARKRKRFATPDEMKKLGQVLDRHAENPDHTAGVAFLYVLMFSGARPTEILRAKPAQLERVVRNEIVYGVLRLHGKTTEATGDERTVFLPPQAMAVIGKLPAKRATLTGRSTMPRRLWRAVRKEIKVPDLWMRDLRRTFGTTALSSGAVTLDQLGELLGHRSRQTTMIYAKLIEDAAHNAAAGVAGKLEEMLCGK